MEESDLDVVVCKLAENIVVLTGFHNIMGWSAVVVPREGEPIVITPTYEITYARDDGFDGEIREVRVFDLKHPQPPPEQLNMRIAEIAAERKFPVKRVGYEGSFEMVAATQLAAWSIVPAQPSIDALKRAWPDAELVDATEDILSVRVYKDAFDIERFRRTNEVAAFGYEALREICLEHPTEAEAAGRMQEVVTAKGTGYKGARFAMMWPQVAAGENTAKWFYYHPSTQKRIEEGDLVLCELACCVDGYYADLTRSFVVGEPTDEQRDLWDASKAALDAAVAAIRPGVHASEVDRAARDAIGAYEEFFPHHTGHGVGWKYHEPTPYVVPHSEHILEEGMYMALEPAAYVPGVGGARNEWNVIVTADGCEVIDTAAPVAIECEIR